uniref:PRA1 family protein n=1 Tax=Acrobeloides nanus TaxID=290746 RepID=A0A914EG85_9BILA
MATEENWVLNDNVQFAPIRSVEEFIFDKNRYEMPSFNDLKKWNNRVTSNLLYFQSNYFIILLAFVIMGSFFYSKAITIGLSAITIVVIILAFSLSKSPNFVQMRADHPYVLLAVIIAACYYFIYFLPSVLTVLFTFALPLVTIFVHASIRLRSIRNRINQQMDNVLRRTAMARFLDTFNIDLKT